MKKISLLLLLLTFLACVDNHEIKIEKENISGTIFSDTLFAEMPGRFLSNDRFLVWGNVFSQKNFLYILDIKNGKELAAVGKIGKGPNEFVTPSIEYIFENNIFIHDLNGTRDALLNIDSVLVGNYSPYLLSPKNNKELVTAQIQIDSITSIALRPKNEKIFEIKKGEKIISFGKPIFKKKINNAYDTSQGPIGYNPSREIFVYSNSNFPYIAIYKKKDNSFDLKYETGIPENPEFTKKGFKRDRKKTGIHSLTFTLDYIVCHQRDYSVDNQDESKVGRNFLKIPKTLFLYDYKGNLKKIVNLGYPVLRITANSDNNTLYAIIIVNDEFRIAKYQL